MAARCGFLDAFSYLIEEGAKPEVINNEGENALHISVNACNSQIVQKIINHVRKKAASQAANGTSTVNTNITNSNEQAPIQSDPVKELINQQNKVI